MLIYQTTKLRKTKRILISAGESSGDLHAANLVKAVHQIDPSIEFYGIGGDHMRAAGVNVMVDLTEISVIGAVEILAHANHILAALKKIRTSMRNDPPDLLVLLDCPGINLRLARTAKKLKQNVLYYISPQIWAWRRGRVKTLRRRINKMLVILPFEEKFYRNANVPVEYVGHPLADEVHANMDKHKARKFFDIQTENKIIALLPGSRKGEIRRLLPIHIASAKKLARQHSNMTFIIPLANSLSEEFIKHYLPEDLDCRIIKTHKNDAIAMSDAAIVTSGTATLEVALLGVPMAIIYKLSPFTYFLGRLLIHVPFIGLCNIVAENEVAKEFIQANATPEKIAKEITQLIDNQNYRQQVLENLNQVKQKLGNGGCSKKAAKAVMSLLQDNLRG